MFAIVELKYPDRTSTVFRNAEVFVSSFNYSLCNNTGLQILPLHNGFRLANCFTRILYVIRSKIHVNLCAKPEPIKQTVSSVVLDCEALLCFEIKLREQTY